MRPRALKLCGFLRKGGIVYFTMEDERGEEFVLSLDERAIRSLILGSGCGASEFSFGGNRGVGHRKIDFSENLGNINDLCSSEVGGNKVSRSEVREGLEG